MMGQFFRSEIGVTMLEQPDDAETVAFDDSSRVASLKTNDVEALGMLYSQHIRPVFAFALTQLGTRSDAEDVAQEAFIALWEARHRIELFGDSILPWLLATARFKSLNLRRAKARIARLTTALDENTRSSVPSPLERLEEEEVSAYIEQAVNSLSSTDRRLFDLCIVDGVSYAKAAESLGLSHQTLRGRLSRLRTRLRRELRPVKGES